MCLSLCRYCPESAWLGKSRIQSIQGYRRTENQMQMIEHILGVIRRAGADNALFRWWILPKRNVSCQQCTTIFIINIVIDIRYFYIIVPQSGNQTTGAILFFYGSGTAYVELIWKERIACGIKHMQRSWNGLLISGYRNNWQQNHERIYWSCGLCTQDGCFVGRYYFKGAESD